MADRQVKVEILGDAKGLRGAFGDAGSAADGFGSKLGNMGKAVAVAGVALVGGLAVGLASCVKAAAESQKVMAQTEAVIKSTGGAAGMTAQQVSDLAGKISAVAPIDDEVIQSAENILLTFTNIGSTVMPAATQAAADMSIALGTDMSSAAMTIGKALNDPIDGLSKLTKQGVTFTDQQRDQVKAMVEAGDAAGAQSIILQELQKEFGGSAEAAGKTFAGQLTILHTQLGNVQESIGMALIPVLTRLLPYVALAANWLGQRLPAAIALVSDWIGRIVARLSGPLRAAFVFVRDAVLTFVQALQGNWTDDSKIQPLHRAIGIIGTVIREQVIPFVKQMAEFFENRVIPAFQKVMPVVQQIIGAFSGGGGLAGVLERLTTILGPLADQFLRWAGEMLVKLLDQVGAWGRALVEWIAPQIPPLLVELGKIALAIGVWAKDVALPAIAAQLLVWGDAFIAWVQPQIVPLLTELGKLLEQLGGWLIDTALPAIGAKLLEWGQAFVAWVGPQIPPLLVELGNLLLALGDWLITTALPAILEKLGQWAAAFIAWVAPQIPPLLVELGGLLAALGDWLITTALPEIVAKLGEWAKAFLDWVATDVVPFIAGKLGDFLAAIGSWFGDEASGAISTAKGYAKDLGKGIINGVVAGIDAIWSTFTGKIDAIGTYVSGVVEGIKSTISGIIGGINGVIDHINSALDFSVSSPGLSILGKQVIPSWTYSFNAPNIPNIPDPFGGGGGSANGGPNNVNANFMPDSITNAPPLVSGPAPSNPNPPLGGGPTPYPGPGNTGKYDKHKPNPWDNLTSNPVGPPESGSPGAPLPPPWEQTPNPLDTLSPTGGAYQAGEFGGSGYWSVGKDKPYPGVKFMSVAEMNDKNQEQKSGVAKMAQLFKQIKIMYGGSTAAMFAGAYGQFLQYVAHMLEGGPLPSSLGHTLTKLNDILDALEAGYEATKAAGGGAGAGAMTGAGGSSAGGGSATAPTVPGVGGTNGSGFPAVADILNAVREGARQGVLQAMSGVMG